MEKEVRYQKLMKDYNMAKIEIEKKDVQITDINIKNLENMNHEKRNLEKVLEEQHKKEIENIIKQHANRMTDLSNQNQINLQKILEKQNEIMKQINQKTEHTGKTPDTLEHHRKEMELEGKIDELKHTISIYEMDIKDKDKKNL